MDTEYDVGLGHEEFKARGESGEYRADLGRYFLDGMRPPPRPLGGAERLESKVMIVGADAGALGGAEGGTATSPPKRASK